MLKISIWALCSLVAVVSGKTCINMTIPVSITARQGIFNVPTIMSDTDVTQFIQNYSYDSFCWLLLLPKANVA